MQNLNVYMESIGQLQTLEEKIVHLLMLRLTPELAVRRAKQVLEDMSAVGLQLNVTVTKDPEGFKRRGLIVPVQYRLSDAEWSINHHDPEFQLEGSELDSGDLFKLCRVCEIGHRLIPALWPSKFKSDLSSGQHHLDTLNEVWWLSRFKSLDDICKLDLLEQSAPDWSFALSGMEPKIKVRLEVKRRAKDIKRHVGRKTHSRLFSDIAHKFPKPNMAGLNLVAITIYSAIDDEINEATCRWLREHSNIDAVLLWSNQSITSAPAAIASRGEVETMLTNCLKLPDEEDQQMIGIVWHTYKHPSIPV
jgi:hypothetical protein